MFKLKSLSLNVKSLNLKLLTVDFPLMGPEEHWRVQL